MDMRDEDEGYNLDLRKAMLFMRTLAVLSVVDRLTCSTGTLITPASPGVKGIRVPPVTFVLASYTYTE